jgi:hypothetical protein
LERQIKDLVAQVKRLEQMQNEKFNSLMQNQIIQLPNVFDEERKMAPRKVSLSIQELEKAI